MTLFLCFGSPALLTEIWSVMDGSTFLYCVKTDNNNLGPGVETKQIEKCGNCKNQPAAQIDCARIVYFCTHKVKQLEVAPDTKRG